MIELKSAARSLAALFAGQLKLALDDIEVEGRRAIVVQRPIACLAETRGKTSRRVLELNHLAVLFILALVAAFVVPSLGGGGSRRL